MRNIRNTLLKSAFFQNVVKLLSGNLIVQIIAFFLATIITRLYTNDDFGLLAKFMSIAGIFTILSTARLEYAIILPKEDDEAYELISLGIISAFVFLSDYYGWKYILLLKVRNYIESKSIVTGVFCACFISGSHPVWLC